MLLTVVAHLLLLILLIRLAPPQTRLPGVLRKLITFNVLPEAQVRTERVRTSPHAATHPRPAAARPSAPPEPRIKMPAAPWVLTPGLERFDVKQVPITRPAEQEAPDDASIADSAYSGGDSKAVYGPSMDGGKRGGGGGERLYYAEWYREPTNAELRYYLPADNRQPGYGEIACQTVERFHVDNCRELGESPPGGGLARAVRQAAWQFLIRPPHVGGRSLVGAWVRIRITYTESEARPR